MATNLKRDLLEFTLVLKEEDTERLKKKAEEGDCASQNVLAFNYYYGVGVMRDHREARKYCEMSEKQGDSFGRALSHFWMFREESKVKEAFQLCKRYLEEHLEEKAREDYSCVLNMLGFMTINGLGTKKGLQILFFKNGDNNHQKKKDVLHGVELTKKAAKLGNAISTANVSQEWTNLFFLKIEHLFFMFRWVASIWTGLDLPKTLTWQWNTSLEGWSWDMQRLLPTLPKWLSTELEWKRTALSQPKYTPSWEIWGVDTH